MDTERIIELSGVKKETVTEDDIVSMLSGMSAGVPNDLKAQLLFLTKITAKIGMMKASSFLRQAIK